MPSPIAIFRCDASPLIGAGHVSRCLALAEALHEFGWDISFVVSSKTRETAPALAASGFNIHALANGECELQTVRAVAPGGAVLVVVDQYERDQSFERSCRSFASKILAFDDTSRRHHDCDVLLDSGAAEPAVYVDRVPSHAAVLTGSAYALMRRSFIERREAALARRDGRPVKSILVSCGATDPMNCTVPVLKALAGIVHDATITVVLSSRAPHLDSVRRHLHRNMQLRLDANNIAELMTDADLAVGAPGATAFERAVLGLPSIMVAFADNQRGVARMMSDAGAVIDAGTLDSGLVERLRRLLKRALEDGELRRRMAKTATALIDGRGALRTMLALHSERNVQGTVVTLRLATAEDEAWLLWLQSQPHTRRHFYNPAIPTAPEHHAWMQRTLSDPSKMLLVVDVNHHAAGMVRLDHLVAADRKRAFEISIAVDPTRHGYGIGSAALRLVRQLMPNAVLDAAVHVQNAASKALFRAAGFAELSDELYRCVPS